MTDTTHLTALHTRLSNERAYLAKETTEMGRQLRKVWIAQCEKEIEGERRFLGMPEDDLSALDDLTDDEIIALLTEGD